MGEEIWKVVPGHEGYAVSNMGRVKSLRRVIERKNNSPRVVSERILRPGPNKSGHLTVALGRGKTMLVHHLVLLTFVGPRPFGFDSLHLDHDPKNNRLNNLKYGTRSENLKMDYEVSNRNRAKAVIARERDGICREFRSVTEASTFYNLSQPAVTNLIRVGGTSRKAFVQFSLKE